MERPGDFWRRKHMVFGTCGHRLLAGPAWIDRYEQGFENCSGCQAPASQAKAPRVSIDPLDASLDDDTARRLRWYHTSTHRDWPKPRRRAWPSWARQLGAVGEGDISDWTQRQEDRALHVGTFEAAIGNMLRRMTDQGDSDRMFYLYRVRLRPGSVIAPGWQRERSDLAGDVLLSEIAPPGVAVVRYLNTHEDAGSVSLALSREAIASVQKLRLPAAGVFDGAWVHEAVGLLEGGAPNVPVPHPARDTEPDWPELSITYNDSPRENPRARPWRLPEPSVSARAALASTLTAELASDLPPALASALGSASPYRDGRSPPYGHEEPADSTTSSRARNRFLPPSTGKISKLSGAKGAMRGEATGLHDTNRPIACPPLTRRAVWPRGPTPKPILRSGTPAPSAHCLCPEPPSTPYLGSRRTLGTHPRRVSTIFRARLSRTDGSASTPNCRTGS